jgi:hypothetical protein
MHHPTSAAIISKLTHYLSPRPVAAEANLAQDATSGAARHLIA